MTITIDFGEYGTRPLADVPPELGPGLASIVTQALAWTPEHRSKVLATYDALNVNEFDKASDRVTRALNDSGAGISSCQSGNPSEPWTAGPWLDALAANWRQFPGAHEVAQAVFARDLGLIAEDDFRTLAGWWIDAGEQLPPCQLGDRFADAAQVAWTIETLRDSRYRVAGWPLAAVSS